MISRKFKLPGARLVEITREYTNKHHCFRVRHRLSFGKTVITIDHYYSSEQEHLEYMQNYTRDDAAQHFAYADLLLQKTQKNIIKKVHHESHRR